MSDSNTVLANIDLIPCNLQALSLCYFTKSCMNFLVLSVVIRPFILKDAAIFISRELFFRYYQVQGQVMITDIHANPKRWSRHETLVVC